MKRLKYLYRMALAVGIIPMLHACSLMGSIDDLQPEHVLTDGTLITDGTSAQQALNGVYDGWRSSGIASFRGAMSNLSHTQDGITAAGGEEFLAGAVEVNNMALEQAYTAYYKVINAANTFMAHMEKNIPDLTPQRREEMLGEARCQRAMAYLTLLRCFGEWFNQASAYGLVLYEDELVRLNEPRLRSSVADTYSLIERDLDYAIGHAPAFTDHYRASSLLAKALKVRVLMATGKYAEAASLADEVLTEAPSCGFMLEEDYAAIFPNSFYSPEMLFAPYTSYPREAVDGYWFGFMPGSLVGVIADNLVPDEAGGDIEYPGGDIEFPDGDIPWPMPDEGGFPEEEWPGDGGGEWPDFPAIPSYDSRYTVAYQDDGSGSMAFMLYGTNKYPNLDPGSMQDLNSYYFMRLAEVYYLKAEAEARSGNCLLARATLLQVIARAGYTEDDLAAVPDADLPGVILKHKLMDLNAENFEEWFDFVRYHREGGFSGWTDDELFLLPSFNRFLLPIPKASLAGNRLLEQNPEYQ